MTDQAPPPSGDNSQSRYEIVKAKTDRLAAIKDEISELGKEANKIIGELEKDSGVNRGALSDIRRLDKLSPAAVAARESSRQELWAWLVQPKLDEAEKGQADE